MTNLGRNYNQRLVVSCDVSADNGYMTNIQNFHNLQNVPISQSDLRAAYGPGFQLSGPTDATLRTIARRQGR